MVEQDTIKLLRECDAGIKMGITSIDDVLSHTRSEQLQKTLSKCKDEHENLQGQVQELLGRYKDEGKDPNPIAKGMSWMKTNMKLAMDESDETIADLMTDGCNMGVKSLNKYLNQYKNADEAKSWLYSNILKANKEIYNVNIEDTKIAALAHDIAKELGTRHRAGVGISEVTDSVTVIVSEETGKVSFAYKGELISVELNGKWGFIDRYNNIVIPIQYRNVCSFEDGKARVQTFALEWYYIDSTGKRVD